MVLDGSHNCLIPDRSALTAVCRFSYLRCSLFEDAEQEEFDMAEGFGSEGIN